MESRVYQNFVKELTHEKVQIDTAFDVIKYLVKAMNEFYDLNGRQKKRVVIKVLEDICSGPDGILYTEDDLLPRHIIDGLRLLIETGMISSSIDLVCEAVLAKTGVSLLCWLGRIFCCCGRERVRDVVHDPLLP
jgi:hypothetical protein